MPFSVRRMGRVSVSLQCGELWLSCSGMPLLRTAAFRLIRPLAPSLSGQITLAHHTLPPCRPPQWQYARCCSSQSQSARSWHLVRAFPPMCSRSLMQVGFGGNRAERNGGVTAGCQLADRQLSHVPTCHTYCMLCKLCKLC